MFQTTCSVTIKVRREAEEPWKERGGRLEGEGKREGQRERARARERESESAREREEGAREPEAKGMIRG